MSVSILDEAWVLADQVALRPEPFGALAYHFGNRRLTFLRTPQLVVVVRSLGEHPDVRTALRAAGVPEREHGAYAGALARLGATDMIRRRSREVAA